VQLGAVKLVEEFRRGDDDDLTLAIAWLHEPGEILGT
jgi:hypothetical protein